MKDASLLLGVRGKTRLRIKTQYGLNNNSIQAFSPYPEFDGFLYGYINCVCKYAGYLCRNGDSASMLADQYLSELFAEIERFYRGNSKFLVT
jgi:hypothetical protein